LKLNNKGFAVSAILYSVLVLFLLILIAFLTVLNNSRNFQIKTNEEVNSFLLEKFVFIDDIVENIITDYYITPYNGNYLITTSTNDGYIYLPKNTVIQLKNNNIVFNEVDEININLNVNSGNFAFNKIDNASSTVLENQIKIVGAYVSGG